MKYLMVCCLLLLAACSDAPPPDSNPLQYQMDSLDKAKKVDHLLQQSYEQQNRQLQQQED